jgi:[ribosomal protein S5]-alanine N-acetyltransferase
MELAHTERLLLRRLHASDAEAYFAIFREASVCRYDDFEPLTRRQAQEDVSRIIQTYETDPKQGEFAVERRSDGCLIGVLCYIVERRSTLIGFHFLPAVAGQGYATEAVRAFLDWLRENVRWPVYALVDPENKSSLALLRRLGFRCIREYPIEVRGRPGREIRFGLNPPRRRGGALASSGPEKVEATSTSPRGA